MQPIDVATLARTLTRAEYDALVGAGQFTDERVELLYGRLVPMSPQGGVHASALSRVSAQLFRALDGRAVVRVQMPVAAADDSEPEPDVAVVDGHDHVDEHPRSAHLIVEVSDSTRRLDLVVKVRLYAEMKCPEYWVLDPVRRELIVHRGPQGEIYTDVTSLPETAAVTLVAFPDVTLAVATFLPAR